MRNYERLLNRRSEQKDSLSKEHKGNESKKTYYAGFTFGYLAGQVDVLQDSVEDISSLKARIDNLHKQLEQARERSNHYGVHLATALKGDKLISEPVDQRLDKVREIVARNIELESLVKTQQAQIDALIISIEVAWRHAKMLERDV